MPTRVYDLHCHSHHSDGILSPEALVSRACAQDIDVLALTDHDTISGLVHAQRQAQHDGIELINGIEFSCQYEGRGVHIVGLNFDIENQALLAQVKSYETLRRERAEQIAHKLADVGVEGALDGARRYAGESVIGRPHFARYLIEAGYVSTMRQAFKKYLGKGKAGDVKHLWPHIEEAVSVIRQAGGVAVLAHPAKYEMTRTKLCALVAAFRECGGLAMELVSGAQQENITRDLYKIAQKFSLVASCGSDFHSPDAPWQELGRFSPLPPDIPTVWQLWESA